MIQQGLLDVPVGWFLDITSNMCVCVCYFCVCFHLKMQAFYSILFIAVTVLLGETADISITKVFGEVAAASRGW